MSWRHCCILSSTNSLPFIGGGEEEEVGGERQAMAVGRREEGDEGDEQGVEVEVKAKAKVVLGLRATINCRKRWAAHEDS